MRRGKRADWLIKYFEGAQLSPQTAQDSQLMGILHLAESLKFASLLRPAPNPEAQAAIRNRLVFMHRESVGARKKRFGLFRDHLLRPVLVDERLWAYRTAVAFSIIAILVVGLWFAVTRIQPKAPPAALAITITSEVEVEVKLPGEDWRKVKGPYQLPQECEIRTLSQRAEVDLGGIALFRLDYQSHMEIAEANSESVQMTILSGRAYHRINENLQYRVGMDQASCLAMGTALDTELSGGEIRAILAIQRDVRVFFREKKYLLAQGNLFDLGQPEQEQEEARISPIPLDILKSEWLMWNKQLDELRGWDTGILSGVTPDERIEPPPPLSGEIDLSAYETSEGIRLEWQVSLVEPESFAILRSSSSNQLLYPRDLYAEITRSSTRAFLDTKYTQGYIYFYRIAMFSEGKIIYSDTVRVATKRPTSGNIVLTSVLLQSSPGVYSIQLKWIAEGDLKLEGWVICRTSNDYEPTYPPRSGEDFYVFKNFDGPKGSYIDSYNLEPGEVYHYRVAGLYQGAVVIYSNLTSQTIPFY